MPRRHLFFRSRAALRHGALVAALAGVAACSGAIPAHADSPAAPVKQVGSLALHACGAAYCGRLARPLDPLGVVPGTVSVYFEFYPH